MFLVLQSSRTQSSVDQYRALLTEGAKVKLRGNLLGDRVQIDMSHEALVAGSLSNFLSLAPYVYDLEFCVLQNSTKFPFVTSDHPVVNTNRYHLQVLGENFFGLATAGALLFMPISPRQAICMYDNGVYKVDGKATFVTLKKQADILALNEMQYLNALQNIYFGDSRDGKRIRDEFLAVQNLRSDERVKITELADAGIIGGKHRFRRFKNSAEAEKTNKKLISFQSIHIYPRKWPSAIEIRMRPKAYSNGSSAGLLRNPEWLLGKKPELKLKLER